MFTLFNKIRNELKICSNGLGFGIVFELCFLLLEYRLKAILPDANQFMTRVRIRPIKDARIHFTYILIYTLILMA